MDIGIEGFHQISQRDANQEEHNKGDIGKIEHICIKEKVCIAQERTELLNHCHIEIAWEVKDIDDRDNISQIKVAFMHLWEQKWDRQCENERELEDEVCCDRFSAPDCQVTDQGYHHAGED